MALAPSFAGVVLAAGASSRMGRDKALLPWRGGTFLSWAIRTLQAVTELVIVVVGENEENLAPIVNAEAAFLVRNPDPAQGQFSSLRIGLESVLDRGRDSAIVTLVHRPPPSIETVERIKHAFVNAAYTIFSVVPHIER